MVEKAPDAQLLTSMCEKTYFGQKNEPKNFLKTSKNGVGNASCKKKLLMWRTFFTTTNFALSPSVTHLQDLKSFVGQ